MTRDRSSRPPDGPIEIRVDPDRAIRRILWTIFGFVALLVLLDATASHAHWIESRPIRRLFNMTREDALGSWLMISLTLITALTAWAMVGVDRLRPTGRGRRVGWVFVAVFLSWMAVDDGAKVHERLGSAYEEAREEAVEEGADPGLFERFPSYAWQFVVLPVLGGSGLVALGFLWVVVGTASRRRMVAGALGCFLVAVGLDFVEGLERDHSWNLYGLVAREAAFDELAFRWFDEPTFEVLDHFSRSFEEAIEITGMALLWAVLAGHLAEAVEVLRLDLGRGRSPSA